MVNNKHKRGVPGAEAPRSRGSDGYGHRDGTDHDDVASRRPRPRRRGKGRAVGLVAALALSGGGYAVWRREHDPSVAWARRVAALHHANVEARLARCFGGSDAASVRTLVPDVRRGTLPTPLRTCRGPALTELVVTPMEFAAALGEPPGAAASAKVRERERLERLRGSLAALQRQLGEVPHDASAVSEHARDRIASALEDVAVDVDAERTTFTELVSAAESGASYF